MIFNIALFIFIRISFYLIINELYYYLISLFLDERIIYYTVLVRELDLDGFFLKGF